MNPERCDMTFEPCGLKRERGEVTREPCGVSRRRLLASAVGGVAGGLGAAMWPRGAWGAAVSEASGVERRGAEVAVSRAALVAGDSRADNVLAALRHIEPEIRKGLAGKKRVLLKPNMVVTNTQLAATHAECLEGILELLSAHHKGEFIIADSPASGPAAVGFENYGYHALAKKYKVRFLEIDEEDAVIRHAVDHRFRPQAVRMAGMLLDRDTYVVSAAMPKTHDRAVVTLSLKNVVVGAAIKDAGFRWGQRGSGANDKITIHGGNENAGINYNLFQLARQFRPDLSVIDGYEGMEGNGPVGGTAVDHRVAVASTDWLAADRIATELMGFDFAKVGYLTFCARAGMGQGDLAKIEVLGERVAAHIRRYKPHDNIEMQYNWMTRGEG